MDGGGARLVLVAKQAAKVRCQQVTRCLCTTSGTIRRDRRYIETKSKSGYRKKRGDMNDRSSSSGYRRWATASKNKIRVSLSATKSVAVILTSQQLSEMSTQKKEDLI
eukprot:scaffold6594_cov162-Amphora_coffeaeformis.AAC.5